MKTVTSYIADDGTEFKTEKACVAYEKRLEIEAEIIKDRLELYDETGKRIIIDESDKWYSTASTIIARDNASLNALRTLLVRDERPYDVYNPEFADLVAKAKAPAMFVYMDETCGSCERIDDDWYNVADVIAAIPNARMAFDFLGGAQ